MSKSPNGLYTVLGIAGIGVGIGVAVNSSNHQSDVIETAQATAQAAEDRAAAAQAAIADTQAAATDLINTLAAQPLSTGAPVAETAGFGLGRDALPVEIAAWDIDVRPDGAGLPAGSGDVWTGEEVFVEKCAMCHGDFGEAVGRWPVLAGGHNTLSDEDPVKTIGSYWPYLSTVYDYINRAMPFGMAQSLTNDEVYAITAYLLYVNDLVDDDFELSNENFLEVRLPNEPNFFMDDRATAEYPIFSVEPCMENCKDSVEITMHASVLDVTPEDENAAQEDATVVAAAAEPEVDLAAEGEALFRQCKSCHQVGDGAGNGVGPHLNGVVDRPIGSVDGFRYSNTLLDVGGEWSADVLGAFLADPRGAMPGTKMAFRGLRSQEEIDAIIAYLATFE
ncbi:MFS transporter [Marivivens niveibacter]|uniref:MFS transporter n=1 Tax=Marivivens niveibacter TaxID=1930667 RepID=A0A251X169_9RHOB|nr:c-type cytochrome [Marivivens niveibacter]OUD10480.1 MFS transporter [Marivivens niveibacter]